MFRKEKIHFPSLYHNPYYRETLWNHSPLTDFWRIGPGIARRLENIGIRTMGDAAHVDEKYLRKIFGVDTDIFIDHVWGREPTTIREIKAYKCKENSLSSGQVLMRDYNYEEGLIILKEMVDLLCLELVDRGLVTNSLFLHIKLRSRFNSARSVKRSYCSYASSIA